MPQWDAITPVPSPPPITIPQAPLPWPARFRCDHKGPQTITRLVKSNGAVAYRPVCERCGMNRNEIPHRSLSLKQKNEALPASFFGQPPDWIQKILLRWEEEWWVTYNAYLLSPEWRLKRQSVLERDCHTCRYCLQQEGTLQVHHLRYTSVGDEPLEDLITACIPCHRRQHSPQKLPSPGLPGDENPYNHST